MRFGRKRPAPEVTKSELGFFELTDRQADLPLRDVFVHFRDLVSADIAWADSRKRRHRRRASILRITALALTAASTVVLGIEAIPDRQWIALPMVAVVTVIGGLETFWSHRPMWVLMEEAQYRFNRLRDEMDFHLVSTPSTELTLDRLRAFYDEQQAIWADVSTRWLGFRELDRELARS
jgi:hypothetical protein